MGWRGGQGQPRAELKPGTAVVGRSPAVQGLAPSPDNTPMWGGIGCGNNRETSPAVIANIERRSAQGVRRMLLESLGLTSCA
jgi:hypothetical protein